MKYTIERYIKGVRGVKIHLSFEIIGYKNRELFVNHSKISENVDTTSASLKIVNNFLFFDKNGSAYCFDLLNNQLFETNKYRAYEHSLKDETFLCIYDEIYDNTNNTFTWCTGLFNFKNQKLITEYKFLKNISIAYFLNQEFLITYLKPIGLGKISLLTGEYEWEVDLGVFYPSAQLSQIIGVWESVLLVSLSNGIILGISTDTGEILWEIPALPALKVHFDRGVHLDTEKGLLYCLSGNGFAVIALANQQVIQSKNDYYVYTEEITEPYQYGYSDASSEFGHSSWQGDYLYFTASKGTAFYTWLGVLHIPTMEVVWEYQNQNGETFNSQPQVADNKLYVLDSGGTLHIFEREK